MYIVCFISPVDILWSLNHINVHIHSFLNPFTHQESLNRLLGSDKHCIHYELASTVLVFRDKGKLKKAIHVIIIQMVMLHIKINYVTYCWT